jgi:hypothetical protein
MADALSQARAALEHANKTFPESKPAHEFSHAPYSMAKSKPSSGLTTDSVKTAMAPIHEAQKEQSDTARGLGWNAAQAAAVK